MALLSGGGCFGVFFSGWVEVVAGKEKGGRGRGEWRRDGGKRARVYWRGERRGSGARFIGRGAGWRGMARATASCEGGQRRLRLSYQGHDGRDDNGPDGPVREGKGPGKKRRGREKMGCGQVRVFLPLLHFPFPQK